MQYFNKYRTIFALVIVFGLGLFIQDIFVKENTPVKKEVMGEDDSLETNESDITVQRVIDGDTLVLSNGEKVRLIGINAPEENEPYYLEAKQALEKLVLNKEIVLMQDIQKKDSLERTLAYLFLNDKFINKELILQGVSVLDTVPPNIVHVDELIYAENNAKKNCIGLWSGLCSRSSCLQISKIQNRVSEKNDEYIELKNTCISAQDLNGYLVKDKSASNSYTFKNISISSKASLKLHSGCGQDTASDLFWQCPEKKNFIWNNNSDSAFLYNNEGKLISEVSY